MAHSIEHLAEEINPKAARILSEIDALVEFCGRAPSQITLLPEQFERIKYSVKSAEVKQVRRKAKAEVNGARLKKGTMQMLLAGSDFKNLAAITKLSYKGVVIKPKHVGVPNEQ